MSAAETSTAQKPAERSKAPRPTENYVRGKLAGRPALAWVMKRTYAIRGGRCELDTPSRQEVLHEEEVPYDKKRRPPRRSPPIAVRDLYPFRALTDVVIQAFAHPPAPDTRRLTVSARFGKHLREIAVFGDRVGEIDPMGRPRVSEPGPIGVVPVRYDFAYGGVDLTALARHGDPVNQFLHRMRAKVDPLYSTRFHYPRNPCGFGYLMEVDEQSWKGLPLPHLEHPGDPLGPERMAVGKPERWVHAPLPAGWDWQPEDWFPRLGYFGLAPEHDLEGKTLAEVSRGWAPKDLLSIPPIHHDPDDPRRAGAAQAASPGMSVRDLHPATTFELTNLHPRMPVYKFRMPGEVPLVKVELSPGKLTELAPHLDSVVVRPVPGEIVVVWSARAPLGEHVTEEQILNMKRQVSWARVEGA
jgi:hypothetical protein